MDLMTSSAPTAPPRSYTSCPSCHGTGRVIWCYGSALPVAVTCPWCFGTGCISTPAEH